MKFRIFTSLTLDVVLLTLVCAYGNAQQDLTRPAAAKMIANDKHFQMCPGWGAFGAPALCGSVRIEIGPWNRSRWGDPPNVERLKTVPIMFWLYSEGYLQLSGIQKPAYLDEQPGFTAQQRPTDCVSDLAHVLDQNTIAQLDSICEQTDRKSRAKFAVVTVTSLSGTNIESYAVDLSNKKWGGPGKSEDRTVLILLAVRDQKYRIEVGHGLESILPNGEVGGVGHEAVPLLRENDYNGAAKMMSSRLSAVIAAAIARDMEIEGTKNASLALTEKGKNASRNWYLESSTPNGQETWIVPIASKKFVGVTGIIKAEMFGAHQAEVEYDWTYSLTSIGAELFKSAHLQASTNVKVTPIDATGVDPSQTYHSRANFVLYDDGWRLQK